MLFVPRSAKVRCAPVEEHVSRWCSPSLWSGCPLQPSPLCTSSHCARWASVRRAPRPRTRSHLCISCFWRICCVATHCGAGKLCSADPDSFRWATWPWWTKYETSGPRWCSSLPRSQSTRSVCLRRLAARSRPLVPPDKSPCRTCCRRWPAGRPRSPWFCFSGRIWSRRSAASGAAPPERSPCCPGWTPGWTHHLDRKKERYFQCQILQQCFNKQLILQEKVTRRVFKLTG